MRLPGLLARRRGGVGVLLWIIAVLRPALALAAPGLTLSPTHGPPFAAISFAGREFCATCGPVSVTFSNVLVARDVVVAADGRFGGSFEVPPSSAGQQRVVASQGNGGPTATAVFFVAPNEPLPSGPPTSASNVPPSADPTTPGPAETSPGESPSGSPGPETASPTPVPDAQAAVPAEDSEGSRWWLWATVGAVVVAAASLLWLGTRRIRRSRA